MARRSMRLADRLQRGDGEEGFRLLAELLPGWLARMVALARRRRRGRLAGGKPGDAPAGGPARP